MRLATLLLAPALALPACVVTHSHTRTYGQPYGGDWGRAGRVEQIRETVHVRQGDPVGGAVAGALIGGLFGSHWGDHHNPVGTVVGALGGAMIGAASSQGHDEERTYEVLVRFEDGGTERFAYRGSVPFRVGDYVTLTPQGLVGGNG